MTFDELYNSNSAVKAICDEAKNPKPFTSDFCRGELLHGMLQNHGPVGLFILIDKNVPLEYQEMVRNYCRENAPACRRADCTEAICSHRYVTDDSYSGLKRDLQPALGSLIERLRHAGGGPEPKWIDVSKSLPDDSMEPIYIVRDEVEVHNYAADLRIRERAGENKLTPWYVKNAFYTCDARARRAMRPRERTDCI